MKCTCRFTTWVLIPLFLQGCCFSNRQIDKEIATLSRHVDDVVPHPAMDFPPPGAETAAHEPALPLPKPEKPPSVPPPPDEPIRPAALFEQEKKPEPPRRKFDLTVPKELPGADQPPLKLPKEKAEREKYLKELFPPLEAVPPLPPKAPGPEGRPMTLADLQRLGATYSPTIKAATAAVEAAKGAVKQAGAYPNPSFFFEQDTVGTGSAGYEGFGVHQTIKTGNKLKLQQASSMMDYLNAKLALRRAYTDLAYQIRGYYFAVLVAEEGVRINDALYRFTDQVYKIQVDLLMTGGFAAAYEPFQLRTLVDAARINLITAQNQYRASWKQLAAALGLRDMPPTELAGRVDMPVPTFEYQAVLDRAHREHTDVRTAYNSISQARFNLALAKVTNVPDVDLNILPQKDYTAPPNLIVYSVQFSVPVPIWNQNKGAIKQAEGLLSQAQAQPDVVRNNLTTTLADAFNRYQTSHQVVQISLRQVRDQLIAYRGIYARRQQLPAEGALPAQAIGVAFADVVTAQQTLATYIQAYVTALGQQWQAVVDVANVLQTDDLFQAGSAEEMVPVPDLQNLGPDHEGFFRRIR